MFFEDQIIKDFKKHEQPQSVEEELVDLKFIDSLENYVGTGAQKEVENDSVEQTQTETVINDEAAERVESKINNENGGGDRAEAQEEGEAEVNDEVEEEAIDIDDVPQEQPRRSTKERQPNRKYSPNEYVLLIDGEEPKNF